MQSLLPDVNTAFITHRRSVIAALQSMDYDKIFGSLNSWNALLPTDKLENGSYKYRILVSDLEYEKLTQITSYAICPHCKNETDYQKLNMIDIENNMVDSILSGEKKSRIWECPKCHIDVKLKGTAVVENMLQEPYFLGVVPKYPQRKDGLQDRHAFERKVKQWAWNFIAELEEKSTAVRKDYAENKLEAAGNPYDNDFDGGEEE